MKNQEIVRISIDLWHPIYKTGTIWKITQTYTHVCVSFCTSHTSSLSCFPPTLSPKMSQQAQSWRSVSVSYWSPWSWSSWSPSSTFSSHWVRIFLRSLWGFPKKGKKENEKTSKKKWDFTKPRAGPGSEKHEWKLLLKWQQIVHRLLDRKPQNFRAAKQVAGPGQLKQRLQNGWLH